MTVVIPAFDVAEYLGECLGSLVVQEIFDRCEIIVVDDGSTDETAHVAQAFAVQYPNVSVVSQANQGPGPGGARNAGLALATGAYVMFLDGDDRLVPGGLDLLHRAAQETGDALVVGAMRSFPETKHYPWDAVFTELAAPTSLPIEDAAAAVHNSAPGNKLIKRSALQKYGLSFAVGIHHQDTYVTVPLMLRSPTVTFVPDVVQLYRRRAGSIMDAHFEREQNFFDHLQVVEHLVGLRPELTPERQAVLDAFLARSMQGFLLRGAQLDEQRARELFTRCGAVYRQVSTEAIFSATRTLQHRLAYSAVIRGDWDDYVTASEPVRSVWAHDGVLYAGQPADEPDPLARAGAVIATVDDVEVTGDRAVLRGTVRIKGTAPVHELNVSVSLRLKGAALALPAELRPTDDRKSTAWQVSTAHVSIPPGTHDPRVVLDTPTGAISAGTRFSSGPSRGQRQTLRCAGDSLLEILPKEPQAATSGLVDA
ncbi:hypothetical protein ASD06_15645 [Angustibacter sp. Root456]|nr:hypothetical protein ASD06_15645 [Angustibacter sp. Root456]